VRVSHLNLFSLIISLSLSGAAHAQELKTSRFDESRWYFYVASGLGRPSYDSDIQGRIDYQKNTQAGSSNQAAYVDLPAIYRRLNADLAIGGVINASFEQISRKWGDINDFAVHTYNPAATVIYFPSGEMGVGFFARGDLGYSRILQIRHYSDPVSGERFDRLNEDGLFTQVAVGYGLRATNLARLLFHINAVRSAGPTHTAQGFNFNVGFMF
jgi:hypothetical protein